MSLTAVISPLPDAGSTAWIRGEIEQNMARVRQFLEEYLEKPEQKLPLQRAVIELHQVRGILAMMQMPGAAILAEEMRTAVQEVLQGTVGQVESVFEVVLAATVQLVDFIEHAREPGCSSSLIFHPDINALRSARGCPVLSESGLFIQHLVTEPPLASLPELTGREVGGVQADAKKYLPAFQAALLGLIRDQDLSNNLLRLGKIAQQLSNRCTVPEVFAHWWLAGALVEAVLEGGLDGGLELKRLMGRLGQLLKVLAEQGEHKAIELETLYGQLFLIGRSRSRGSRVQAVRSAYGLDALLPTGEALELARTRLRGPSSALLRTLAAEIRKDISLVKDNLDLLLRAGDRAPDKLDQTVDTIRRVASTLEMLGLASLKAVVAEQAEVVQARKGGQPPSERAWLQAATSLLWVEHNLDDLLARQQRGDAPAGPPHLDGSELSPLELRGGTEALVRESKGNLIHVREVVQNLVTTGDTATLPEAIRLLHEVASVFQVLNRPQAQAAFERLRDFVALPVVTGIRTQPDSVTRLAEALAAAEYYISGLQGGDEDTPHRLQIFQRCLEALPDLAQSLVKTSSVAVPPVAAAVAAPSPAEPVLTLDPEIRDIFLEEVGDIRASLDELLPRWVAHLDDVPVITDIRRAFHTLKGSGRMVGAVAIGDFGWAVENLLNRCLEGTHSVTDEVVTLVQRAHAALPALLEAFNAGSAAPAVLSSIVSDAVRLTGGDEQGSQAALEDELLLVFRKDAAQQVRTLEAFLATQGEGGTPVPHEVMRAFHTLKSGAAVAGMAPLSRMSGAMEGLLEALSNSNHPLTPSVLGLMRESVSMLQTALQAAGSDQALADDVAGKIENATTAVQGDVIMARALTLVIDFTNEAADLAEQLRQSLLRWIAAPDTSQELPVIDALLSQLAEGARKAEIAGLLELVTQFQGLLPMLQVSPNPPIARLLPVVEGLFDLLDKVRFGQRNPQSTVLLEQLQQLADELAQLTLQVPTETGIDAAPTVPDDYPPLEFAVESAGEVIDIPPVTNAEPEPLSMPTVAEPMADIPPMPMDVAPDLPAGSMSELDGELLEIFLEEAQELVEALDGQLDRWERQPSNTVSGPELMRILHTLKGSARTVGALALSQTSHVMEDAVIAISISNASPDQAVLSDLRRQADILHAQMARLQAGQEAPTSVVDAQVVDNQPSSVPDVPAAIAEPVVLPESEAPGQTPATMLPPPSAPTAVPLPAAAVRDPEPAVAEQPMSPVADSALAAAPWYADLSEPDQSVSTATTESARVPVARLEKMLNEAGEVALYRGRLEQANSDANTQLGEFATAITRLREQLRQLELETEAQVQARQQQLAQLEGSDRYGEEFDPLEMDRYTRINEITRALRENATDLLSLHDLLEQMLRSNDALLIQQGRIATGLQRSLMDSLLVPFSRQAQRLARSVRQVCQETGKQAQIEFEGIESDLDRNVLERMVGALEHLLRNAIVHGIESPEKRIAAGKAVAGRVLLSLRRDGAHLQIDVQDDGQGLDLARIRQVAVQRGLMVAGAELADDELKQMIFQPGFSTAESVSQLAGRGVGMDVVRSEIKQLGGSIDVLSEAGQGTRFIIRIPVSLALTHVLLVRAGVETYAVPVAGIAGIDRIATDQVAACLAPGAEPLQYLEQSYRPYSLTTLVQAPHQEEAEKRRNQPVIYMRTGDHGIALIVDAIDSSREVVLKPLGAQLSSIPALSGATILGDGSVVVILDVPSLLPHLRIARTTRTETPAPPEGPTAVIPVPAARIQDRRPLVMVVDDSITIRRVTERILQRHGYRVEMAKDGMDALPKLQNEPPDLILLDIEMPRIDGFELATYVRGSENTLLKQVPLVMITSRSGDKHRQRAEQIGVNRFMVKPFQEDELIATIEALLHERRKSV